VQLALFFLKLGTIAFGGPAAHVAIMEDELVRRRKWVTPQDFLDLLAVANLLPGPSSTELAIFIGFRLRRWAGLLVAGCCFILPAFLIVIALAWAYVRYGGLPAAVGILYGIKPVVIAIIVQGLWRLSKTAVKTRMSGVVGVLALIASFAGISPVVILAGAATFAALSFALQKHSVGASILPLTALQKPRLLAAWVPIFALSATTTGIFLLFLKFGCVVFGSGYVLLAFLRADLVTHRHWLTESQLLDAVAVGQVTPGPVFTTATFIGYLLAGSRGAVAATVGIFAPAFVFVAAAGPFVARLRGSKVAGAMLDGLNVASLALMAWVTWQLAQAAIVGPVTWAVALISAAALLCFRVNSLWLIVGGAAVGVAVTALPGHF
jgi:chromate transporter